MTDLKRPKAALLRRVILLGSLLGCSSPLEVRHEVALDPPPVYRVWWGELQQCTSLSRDFERIRWFTGESLTLDGAELYGVWRSPDTIVMKRFYLTSRPAVKHEMLHHLTDGTLPHSAPAFRHCT